jgi:hypothetical protein
MDWGDQADSREAVAGRAVLAKAPGLVVGALVDRRARKPVMAATDCAQSVLLLSIPAAWAVGIASCAGGAPSARPSRIDGADAVAQTSGPAMAGHADAECGGGANPTCEFCDGLVGGSLGACATAGLSAVGYSWT